VRELLEAQRREIVRLRNQGEISDEVMHRIERYLDLEDSRLSRASWGRSGHPLVIPPCRNAAGQERTGWTSPPT
jgi:hypothetical protein